MVIPDELTTMRGAPAFLLGLIVLSLVASVLPKQQHGSRGITVQLKVPDATWSVWIQEIRLVRCELWVHAHLSSSGFGAQVISTISDTVTVWDQTGAVKRSVTGKTWGWRNSEQIEFIQSIDDLGEDWIAGEEVSFTR